MDTLWLRKSDLGDGLSYCYLKLSFCEEETLIFNFLVVPAMKLSESLRLSLTKLPKVF